MKTKKISLENISNVLSRDQLKKVMAGTGTGDCMESGSSCNTNNQVNCCSGLVCAGYVCRTRTR